MKLDLDRIAYAMANSYWPTIDSHDCLLILQLLQQWTPSRAAGCSGFISFQKSFSNTGWCQTWESQSYPRSKSFSPRSSWFWKRVLRWGGWPAMSIDRVHPSVSNFINGVSYSGGHHVLCRSVWSNPLTHILCSIGIWHKLCHPTPLYAACTFPAARVPAILQTHYRQTRMS
jgi:hypothetical protein